MSDMSAAEAREQIARSFAPTHWPILLERHRDLLRARADVVLAIPAVAEALAALERVRALADAMEAEGTSLPPGGGAVADTTACERIMTAHRLREVLTASKRSA